MHSFQTVHGKHSPSRLSDIRDELLDLSNFEGGQLLHGGQVLHHKGGHTLKRSVVILQTEQDTMMRKNSLSRVKRHILYTGESTGSTLHCLMPAELPHTS